MLHPTRPTTLGSLFLGALLSACTYSSSDGMTIFSEDGSTYAKSVWQNGNLSMTLTKDGETTIYRVLGEQILPKWEADPSVFRDVRLRAIATAPRFSAARMVQAYNTRYYDPQQ